MAARLIVGGRKWASSELKGSDTTRFKGYLRDMHINFETSDAGYGYTHFECLMSEEELNAANVFIDSLG